MLRRAKTSLTVKSFSGSALILRLFYYTLNQIKIPIDNLEQYRIYYTQ
jgi:hypothetical protein